MTDITLRPGEAAESGLAFLAQLLKELFRATPLGMVLAIAQDKR